ncbi:6-carboxytetrahydropterin synthase [Methanoplanus endosymbiosus]|uniref:6-carboxytetrahydropterin synthase n=1 Tax=Methanoplanus endosymbiosus TaxID=33865 RepID=A0A9E7PTE6_9EURY|nr:6-carboxytetrahydropterin synthase [Methanoplanus endosymbiosus]UUX93577.1 6-carboxytetrahydropterin synthase [Methanoplanus endosymbiosus]
MTIRIYKEVYIEASHRLMHYKGKCNRLHGHQWRIEVWAEGETAGDSMILIDYNVIKEAVNRYDHEVILNKDDPMAECLGQFQEVIKTDGDPTSELLSERIAADIQAECDNAGITATVTRCRVWESTSCYADWNITE